MPRSHAAAAAFPLHVIQHGNVVTAVRSYKSTKAEGSFFFFALFSMVISQVWVSQSPQPRAGFHHLPWLRIDSLPSWLVLGLEDLLPLLLHQRSGCRRQILGALPGSAALLSANLNWSRSSSCCCTPTCKHSGRPITIIQNKTKPLAFSSLLLMKLIKLHAKKGRLNW